MVLGRSYLTLDLALILALRKRAKGYSKHGAKCGQKGEVARCKAHSPLQECVNTLLWYLPDTPALVALRLEVWGKDQGWEIMNSPLSLVTPLAKVGAGLRE